MCRSIFTVYSKRDRCAQVDMENFDKINKKIYKSFGDFTFPTLRLYREFFPMKGWLP